jgi:hypothetical protein
MPIKILWKASSPWGDYGTCAVHGDGEHVGTNGDRVFHLHRSGTFVPPMTFPGIGVTVVTDAFRRRLESAPFGNLGFRPVVKAHIVQLEWRDWDPDGDPADMPDSGEPEDLLSERPHDPALAREIGDLWEVVFPVGAVVDRILGPGGAATGIVVRAESWTGADFFRAEGVLHQFVSERAQDWLGDELQDWVAFRECRIQ